MKLNLIKEEISNALEGVNDVYPSIIAFFWRDNRPLHALPDDSGPLNTYGIPEGYECLRVEISLVSDTHARLWDNYGTSFTRLRELEEENEQLTQLLGDYTDILADYVNPKEALDEWRANRQEFLDTEPSDGIKNAVYEFLDDLRDQNRSIADTGDIEVRFCVTGRWARALYLNWIQRIDARDENNV